MTLVLLLALPVMAWQDQNTSTPQDQDNTSTPELSPRSADGNSQAELPKPLSMISHTTKAIDYRQGSTSKVDLKGTQLMPQANGQAKVETHTGRTTIEAKLEDLSPANSLGLEYLTYVLWAISPDGRPANLGEMVVKDGKTDLKTTTPLQAFALIVTAEPDFAVTQPGDQIVAENIPGKDTQGWIRTLDVNYELLPHQAYADQVEPVQKPVYGIDKHVPLSLLEARNAVRIAKDSQADEYAPQPLQNAQQLLDKAEDYYRRHQGSNAIATVAREAVQAAEAARVMSLRAEEQARLRREREDQERRTQEAQAQAAQAQAQQQAEAQHAAEARAAAEQAQQQAQLAQQQAQQQAQMEAQQRQQLEAQQQAAAQQAAQAQAAAQQEAQQRAAAEQAAQQAQLQAQQAQQQAQQQIQQAQQEAEQARQQTAQTRARLLSQLNQVLQTRDSARGLIVNMPDVLFDSGKANLRATARERLAKVAGILIAYPNIKVEVDGYTDSVGTEQFNQQLSEERAGSVRSYLSGQGVPADSISTRGFGESDPIASNTTASGRQENRRVELVVSGQSIGNTSQQQPGDLP
jgi:outer membrane protein OmpA-like peptidoglycan-associated protein